MRILIQSRGFPPEVGGQETVMEMLAEGFVREGHEVKVVTATSEVGNKRFPFDVVRNPGSVGSLASSTAVAAISLLSRLAPLGSGR